MALDAAPANVEDLVVAADDVAGDDVADLVVVVAGLTVGILGLGTSPV